MAARVSRGRQSTATPGPSGTSGGALPAYQPPTFPLNANAQRALANLLHKHDTKKLSENIGEAQSVLIESAADIYDRLHTREERVASVRNKHQEQGVDADSDESLQNLERKLAEKRDQAQKMNDRIEQELRKLIDTKHAATSMQEAVKAAETDARNNASTQASTKRGQTQRTRRSGRGNDEEDVDEEDTELPDFTPTDPAGGTQPPTAPRNVYLKHMETAKTRYQACSLSERYADDETYQSYKRAIHDSRYPGDEVEMPPQSQWFNEDGVPAPGVITRGGCGDDSDDDIAIQRTTVSTRCPLTLREMEKPLSSKKCRHVFERDAINEMIRISPIRSAPRPGHRGGQPAVQCPVSGCQQQLTRDDLHVDKVTVRKIKRIQEARRLREEGEDEDDEEGAAPDGTQRRGHVIDSDGVNLESDDEPRTVKPKSEPRPTGATSTQRPSGSASRSTQVIDLGRSEEEEDEDMDD